MTAVLVAVVFLLLPGFLALPSRVIRFYRKQVEKFSADPASNSFVSKSELIIDEKDIQTRDGVSISMHLWRAFTNKIETEKYFYLYLSSLSGLVIPQKKFSNASIIKDKMGTV